MSCEHEAASDAICLNEYGQFQTSDTVRPIYLGRDGLVLKDNRIARSASAIIQE